MDARTRRLIKHYKLNSAVAQALIDAGLTTPRLIKAASDEELRNVEGIGQATLDDIRDRRGAAVKGWSADDFNCRASGFERFE